jgi:hypothetical protein
VKAGKSNVKALCGVGMTGIRWYAVPKGWNKPRNREGPRRTLSSPHW